MSTPVPPGATCTHPNMTECHPGCGHFFCPDCQLTWDENAEGDPVDDEEASVLGGSLLEPYPVSATLPAGSRPRRVTCLCAPTGHSEVREGRWIHTVEHSLMCPVTEEQGTIVDEFDEGPVCVMGESD